jgi:hypothetical protein
MIIHLRNGQPWFKLIKRSRELRFCYIPLIVVTPLLVTLGEIHTSKLAFTIAGSKPV